jgi:betaine lipid synthase
MTERNEREGTKVHRRSRYHSSQKLHKNNKTEKKKLGKFRKLRRTISNRSLQFVKDGKRLREDVAPWVKSIWVKMRLHTHRNNVPDYKGYLERVYAPQAKVYDRMRAQGFLWGRKPMLAACAERLTDEFDKRRQPMIGELVWVDLGGGTAENISLMSKYIPLDHFKAIYVVDLCSSLCDIARQKVKENGWTNVHVVEKDACDFEPKEGMADLVTFSYSLSMIRDPFAAIDKMFAYLNPDSGVVGVSDFYVSAKFDFPHRQMGYMTRIIWKSIFDIDNIDLGPERRQYLDHRLVRVFEYNSAGTIPYIPFLKAPYYTWVGVPPSDANVERAEAEAKRSRPMTFPPTFIYSVNWEDPIVDKPILKIGPDDVVLTLTSGGCNTLHLAAHGAKHVASVDLNPAQSALCELKVQAIKRLEYEDVWKMFGEGKHENIAEVFESKLAPWLSQGALNFWSKKLHYFKDGLYYHGAMGKVLLAVYWFQVIFGYRKKFLKFTTAPTLEEQRKIWTSFWFVKIFLHMPHYLFVIMQYIVTLVFLNKAVCWLGLGVPPRQYNLIGADGRGMCEYAGATLHGAAMNTRMSKDNYFYRVCLAGSFTKESCPEYLTASCFKKLKGGLVDNISVHTDYFGSVLALRKYTKVILMDHVDWLNDDLVEELAQSLEKQVVAGGRIIWRSASLNPPYVKVFEKHGFDAHCVHRITDEDQNGCIDLVNMYASFWYADRRK